MTQEPKSWQYGYIFNRLQNFFTRRQNCPLKNCEFGYIEKHSMETAVLHIKEFLEKIDSENAKGGKDDDTL